MSTRRYDYGRQQMMDEDDEMEDGARGGFVFGGYSVPFSRNRAYEDDEEDEEEEEDDNDDDDNNKEEEEDISEVTKNLQDAVVDAD